jgi:signal transduction histidine kinase
MSKRDGQQPSRLRDFVEARRDEILQEWERRVRARLPAARDLSEPALRDHLPRLLQWVAGVIGTDDPGGELKPGQLPAAHAESRVQEGYDLNEVAQELALLRQVILELWEAEAGANVVVEEVVHLGQAIDLVLERSVRAFADARQHEVQQRLEIEEELIGIVSHDLRNPLSTILTTADGLLRHHRDDGSTGALIRICNATERAERLVRDLLDFTRARLGTGIPVERRSADLHAVVRGVLDEARAQANGREIVHVEEGDGGVQLDPDRIAQVAHNLLTNALKYSPPDTIVTVRTRGEAEAVSLEVHNGGTPIAAEELAHLFEPLHRGALTTDSQDRSVGLGLYIVESIVRAHCGTVIATSTAEAGTVFMVRLPRAPTNPR